ncbi:uncharacterized protein LOC141910093 [Tubulanus polymorphus]|uniref:uncharacterized protein LOC141910093 n=1 Tax=Tubulanus polymorphus TaxID=672921 RepID=UPI003DA43303
MISLARTAFSVIRMWLPNPCRHRKLIAIVIAIIVTSFAVVVVRLTTVPRFRHFEDVNLRDEILNLESRNHSDSAVIHSRPVVPRILHLAWYGNPTMRFHHYVSFLSAYHILKPERILFWYGVRPSGAWWRRLRENITEFDRVVEMRYRAAPTEIHGRAIQRPEHSSDVVRLEAILEYGGIYLDLDVIVLHSFDRLLRYSVTLGREHWFGLCNGILIARPNALFMRIWRAEYRTFDSWRWATHSVVLPHYLARRYPYLVHIEERTLNRPNWMELDKIYANAPWNWRENYAVHLWYRKYGIDHDFDSIKNLDSNLGRIFRFILYGDSDLFDRH